jgi:hypothetical protein
MIIPLSSHNPSTNLTAVRNRYLLGNNTNHNDFALLRVSALGPYLIPKAINWRHGDSAYNLPRTLQAKHHVQHGSQHELFLLYTAQLTTNSYTNFSTSIKFYHKINFLS